MQRLAVLTSGGDAPSMNAAIRAVVRMGLETGCEALGVKDGYAGLIAGQFRPLDRRDVGHIIQSGGTMLGSSRCPELRGEGGVRRAADRLRERAAQVRAADHDPWPCPKGGGPDGVRPAHGNAARSRGGRANRVGASPACSSARSTARSRPPRWPRRRARASRSTCPFGIWRAPWPSDPRGPSAISALRMGWEATIPIVDAQFDRTPPGLPIVARNAGR